MAQAILKEIGPKLYPGTLGERILLYTDLAKVDEYYCRGYELDEDGEIVMILREPSGEKFTHNRRDLVRFQIIEKDNGNSQ